MVNKKDYTDVLLEDINSKFDAVLDAVGGMQDQIKKIPKMAERLEKIESDLIVVKLDASLTRNDTRLIKIRTEKLEDILEEVNSLQKRVKTLETAQKTPSGPALRSFSEGGLYSTHACKRLFVSIQYR